MATERLVNNGQTTVASAYSAGATSLVVTNAALLPTLSGSDQYHILVYNSNTPTQAEIMLVTAVAGNTLTVTPAREAVAGVQTSFDHAAGDVVAAVLTVESLTAVVEQLSLNSTEADLLYAAIGHNHDASYQPLDAQLTSLAGLAYAGNAAKVVRVNAGETAFELAAAATGDVTAAANLADNAIVRGDGGAKGVQTSTATISDDGVVDVNGTTPTTDGTVAVLNLRLTTTGTAAADFGLEQHAILELNGGEAQVADRAVTLVNAAVATFKARETYFIRDAAGAREYLRAEATGAAAAISFLGGGVAASPRLVSPDAGTALVTFGLASGTPTFAWANITGDTTVGSNLVTLANPSAVTFLRVNADNTVSALSASDFRTAIGSLASSMLDTDGTLAANSDAKIPSQKAVKTYVDTAVTGLWDFKGSTDCSANPDYPAGVVGDAYLVSVAGRIGGASGKQVDAGDVYVCTAINAGGAEAAVGTSWTVIEHNLTSTNVGANLYSLADPGAVTFIRINADNTVSALSASDFRTAIGAQPLDAALTALAGGSDFVQFTGPTTATKVFTLPDANATLLYAGGALGTPSSGTLTNCAGLPDAGVTFTDVTTGNASTTAHGYSPKATAPAAGLLSVLGIGNGETVRSDKALFDTTNPEALGTAAPGTALVAARRDHVHALPSGLLPNYASPSGMRLSLTSGASVMTADVTSAGTVYLAVHDADFLLVPNSGATDFEAHNPGELSLALTLTADKNYDVFVWNNSGTLTLALSSAWTSDTARNDALGTLKGVYVNNATIGSMGAKRGIYLGTLRASAANTTCWIAYPAAAAGTAHAQLYLWNLYNPVPQEAVVKESTDSWTYATNTWRKYNGGVGGTGNRVSFVRGLNRDDVLCLFQALLNPSATATAAVGVGLDITNGMSGWGNSFSGVNATVGSLCGYAGKPGLGFHYLQAVEKAPSSATVTFYGDQGDATTYQASLAYRGMH